MSKEQLRSEFIEVTVDQGGPLLALECYIDRVRDGGGHVLRCGLVSVSNSRAVLEVCVANTQGEPKCQLSPDRRAECAQGLNVALVVPTGVGASIGGFIGDASPVARAFEAVADVTILHPNVVNGADLYGAGDRSLYVDGFTLDEFFAGRTLLGPALPK